MLTILYKFEVKKGMEDAFVDTWTRLTEEILKIEGSLGSRLQRDRNQPGVFWGYAQWETLEAREQAMAEGNAEALTSLREATHAMMNSFDIIFEADVSADLLGSRPNHLQPES